MLTNPTKEARNKEAASDKQGVQAPTISLPKGGGAIRGMGEKFPANPVTGTGPMTVPIASSPGRGGFGPPLALSYDSGAGNGPFGLGWNLSLLAITHSTDRVTGLADGWFYRRNLSLIHVVADHGARRIDSRLRDVEMPDGPSEEDMP